MNDNNDEIGNLENYISSKKFNSDDKTLKQIFNGILSLLKKQHNQIKSIDNIILEQKNKANENQLFLENKFNLDDVNLLVNNKIDEMKLDIEELKSIKTENSNQPKPKNFISSLSNKNDKVNFNVLNKKINNLDTHINNLKITMSKQFSEYNSILENIRNNKVDLDDLSKLIENINNKVDIDVLSKVTEETNNSIIKILDSNNDELKNELNDNFTKFKQLDSEFKKMNIQEIEKIGSEIKSLNEKIELLSKKSMEIDSKLNLSLEYNKVEVENKIKNLALTINNESITNGANYNNLNQLIRTIYNEYNNFKVTIQNELSIKPNISDINSLIHDKVDYRTLDSTILEINKIKEKLEEENFEHKRIFSETARYPNNNLYQYKNFEGLKNQIIEIKDSLKFKIGYNEVLNYLKNKVNVDELNNILVKMRKDFNRNNIIGKWISTNNELYKNNIKWNNQSENTNENYFVWNNENYYITITNKGIYQIELILFIGNKQNFQIFPNVKFLINDKTIKNYNNIQNDISNEILGLNFTEYIELNKKSKLSISITSNGLVNEFKGILIIKSV
jgi:hypothetical protein